MSTPQKGAPRWSARCAVTLSPTPLLGASYVAFADTGKAEELAGSVTGTVLPFSYDERPELIADPALRDCDELYFNAGRLDRSIALASEDYLHLARPRIARIVAT